MEYNNFEKRPIVDISDDESSVKHKQVNWQMYWLVMNWLL